MTVYFHPSYQSVLKGTPTLDGLPKELILNILKFLEGTENLPLKFVNKKFNKIDVLRLKITHYNIYKPGVLIGSIDYLKWIKSLNYPLKSSDCIIPAGKGDIKMLIWLKENQCHADSWALICAAEVGHLETLKWLRKAGCDWDEMACRLAAANDQLQILKWLRENGCPWIKEDCLYVAKDPIVRKWINENG